MAHREIRIPFEIEDRRYEAVGFLNERENYVDGDEMFSRTDGENGGGIGDEDEAFLSEHRAELPAELQPYWLVTGKRDPDDPRIVSCFLWFGGGWCQGWSGLVGGWSGYYLVVRRCA